MGQETEHVCFENVSYRYSDAQVDALQNINISIAKTVCSFDGCQWCRKNYFLSIIKWNYSSFFRRSMVGSVKVAGLETTKHKIAELSQKVGMVLQDPETQLFTGSVRSEVAFGAENLGVPRQEISERLKWALHVVRLDEFMDRTPAALSGGQKQRLAIASVIAMRPEILVLDEPTSNLTR